MRQDDAFISLRVQAYEAGGDLAQWTWENARVYPAYSSTANSLETLRDIAGPDIGEDLVWFYLGIDRPEDWTGTDEDLQSLLDSFHLGFAIIAASLDPGWDTREGCA